MSEWKHNEPEADFLNRVLRSNSLCESDLKRLTESPPPGLRQLFAEKAKYFLRKDPSLHDQFDDIAQETLHELEPLLSRFRGRSSLKTYLIAIVQNKCAKTARDKAHQEQLYPISKNPKTGKQIRFDPPDVSGDPLEVLIAAEADPIRSQLIKTIRESIPDLLNGLSPQAKRILELRYGDSENTPDWESIADLLDINVDSAKRIRDRVRRKIETKWFPELLRPVIAKYRSDGIDARILHLKICLNRTDQQTAAELRIDKKEVKKRMRCITDELMRIVVSDSENDSESSPKTQKPRGARK